MTHAELRILVDDLLTEAAGDVGAMVTGWALVVETYDPEHDNQPGRGYNLLRLCDDSTPAWRLRGMLTEILDHWHDPAWWHGLEVADGD